ncbi:MAG: type II secretion system protein, partial [Betaproteobacteria bacterium]
MCSTSSRSRRARASTASPTGIGKPVRPRSGFTLIELLVVMAIIALLLTLAIPRYFGSLERSKEAVLREDLYQLRDAIGKYYGDKG